MSEPSRWHRPRAVFEGLYDPESITVTLSLALALYNAIELTLLIFTTFKKWHGLYFWSLCVSNFGVVSYSLGLIIEYFQLAVLWVGKIFDTGGWILMITGQSLVLYSRLNLIMDQPKVLKAVKWMIIFNAVVWHTTLTVLDFGTTYTNNQHFAEGFFYTEHVQMTMFCLQEFIISGLYVWRTIAFLKVVSKKSTRSVIWQLFTINVIIIAMDIALLFMQYKHWRIYQQATKAFIYSVKLKLELNILSKLVDLVQGSKRSGSHDLGEIDTNAIPGQAQNDLYRELSTPSSKGIVNHMENGHAVHPSEDDFDDDDAGAVRTLSENSRAYSARTTGRDSDILYADVLRSIK
ncbi:uncharacterized protein HMPREF1541_03083 [Cyphellophora europaea CBS 101466]|uniref:DUF7703 domain-containing protein n=1 Tax=Cyphellophora europaea (strain CBS 101466) TaxID=1220924 RepID=W2RZE2_CYPE1|nr:uncharacterized protein HMPREF1541_03083 [Cyphellophora europaea CBS 101466]ETN41148.1 hypothetical protein HMPREF1541_03083 [Cyphellophora europaea CBS 101466]